MFLSNPPQRSAIAPQRFSGSKSPAAWQSAASATTNRPASSTGTPIARHRRRITACLKAITAASHSSLAVLWLAVVSTLASAAPPKIDNRPARPDEWGYRPADGATVRLNPPSLTWVHITEANSYVVEWASNPEFRGSQRVEGIRWPTYTHNAVLTPGRYWWRYYYIDKKGERSTPSAVRSFVVPSDATAFPMPTRAEQRQRVPKAHPRLFMRPEDLPRLRQLAKTSLAKQFQELKTAADRIIAAGPTPEPNRLGSARDKENAELIKYWWPNREQTEKACKEAETIAFVYLISQEKKYGDAARRWIMHLASWNPDGPTNFRLNCEAAKPMLFRPARAYDWAYDTLSAEDRAKFQAVMKRRINDCWESGEVQFGVGHLSRPYSSHGNRVWHKMAESAIAMLDEVPEAETWLDYAVNKFYACYPVWADDDGGWHEGVSYWASYNAKAVWWLQVAQSALKIDACQKPFYSQVADYAMYVAPPGSPNMGFGDLSARTPSSSWGGWLDYHLRVSGARTTPTRAVYWKWWADQWRMKPDAGWLGFLYMANLPPSPAPKPPADLPPSKVFHGIGVASLHTNLLDSRDDVHLLFKSSPMGSRSHGHNPQNSFQLNAFGESLLTTCVYRDLHGSKFHFNWVHSTVAHNAVLVNGEGQIKPTVAARGAIVAEHFSPQCDYVAGDAVAAYGGGLTRAIRHVALVRQQPAASNADSAAGRTAAGPFVVIYDELAAEKPSTFQFMLHGFSKFDIDPAAQQLRVEQPAAGCIVQYAAPVRLAFRQWDGYNPPPKWPFPNQFHVEAGTEEPLAGIDAFTVIVPYRIDQRGHTTSAPLRPRTVQCRRSVGDGAAAIEVTIDARTTTVVFRQQGSDAATYNGRKLTSPIMIVEPGDGQAR